MIMSFTKPIEMADVATARMHLLPTDSVVLGEKIGNTVWRATYTGKLGQKLQVAAKRVPHENHSEILVMHQVNHKHIIKFYGVWQNNDHQVYIIMEHAERGNLRQFLDDCKIKDRRLTKELCWKWIYEAACALHYLSSTHHSHRDIKSKHFLITEDYTLKLSDFGLTKRLETTQQTIQQGTFTYMAPEVIRNQERSPKSDIFSFGILVWEITTTDVPFANCLGTYQVMCAVCDGERPPIPDDCPELLKSLMVKCWDDDRTKRPNIQEVCLDLESCK